MDLKKELSKFKEIEIKPDLKSLNAKEKKLLFKLVDAAKLIHEIFLDQVHPKNLELKKELELLRGTDKEDSLKMFEIHCAPFDTVTHSPFIEGQIKLKGANFYPADMTIVEFEEFIKKNPKKKDSFTTPYSLIRRKNNVLVAIPYSEAYKDELKIIAKLLLEASTFADNSSLKDYLEKISKSLLSNNYFDSDVAWIDLKETNIEALFGPYEVYLDGLLGLKATFEAVIGIVDKRASSDLKFLEEKVDELDKNLPLPPKYKSSTKGNSSPIVVIDEVFSAGDNRAGIHFTAFNLPNDEKVKELKGSKKVLLKNIAKAKYEHCMTPIIKEIFDEETLKHTDFDSYFTHILLHEISHGIGPGIITLNGEKVSVNTALKDLYPTIEEAKADVLGVFNAIYLRNKKVYTEEFVKKIITSFVGGIFRSIRFGFHEAHAGANLIVLNYLMEQNCLRYNNKTRKFFIRYEPIEQCFTSLAEMILLIQAEGDYEKAKDFVDMYRDLTPGIKEIIARLKDAPTDITPKYTF